MLVTLPVTVLPISPLMSIETMVWFALLTKAGTMLTVGAAGQQCRR